ncbi:MAG TPA: hypothetical protein VG368_07270 [Acidimicrobiales bacterium]|jgi:hypothetical protein|nr:hypothetical protein [Acidimicrobiales bacterium]
MPFGQQSGPPASSKQLRDLLALLQEVGHADFRDARGPMGFSQRQAGGRFTRQEADEMIERLQTAQDGEVARAPVVAERLSLRDQALAKSPDDVLARELDRRGWIVIAP